MCHLCTKFCENRFSSFAYNPANKQTNQLTNADENITSLAEVIGDKMLILKNSKNFVISPYIRFVHNQALQLRNCVNSPLPVPVPTSPSISRRSSVAVAVPEWIRIRRRTPYTED